ncbi:hypothetical protein [Argonema galeatum]|uniref:hypothetical protein n=1 Tax=Argonema galeatum TaxID=2942762 RepID=UPI00201300C0|nr:hypothetical protein [Argonema galeatum]MCL1463152.1 hypothetical protein [Argonema galeatum A003/A1]
MGMNEFVSFCKGKALQSQEDYIKFFEDVVCGRYSEDKELLLQAFLFFNVQKYFTSCKELILFEQSPDVLGNTHLGKCDLVYLTDRDSLFVIETKYIDTQATGDTAKKRRNKQRNQVINQVIDFRDKLSIYWQIPIKQLRCGVFTTDLQPNERGFRSGVIPKSISILDLEEWQENKKNEVLVADRKDFKNDDFVDNYSENDDSSNTLNNLEVSYEDLLYMTYSCDVCFNRELCNNLMGCWFDFQGEGD